MALSRFGRAAFGHTGHPSEASPTTVADQPGLQGSPTLPPALEGAAAQPAAAHVYGTVISGGRVIDPASGFDGVAHVGIDGGTITAVSTQPLHGAKTIDATGKVVSPGFIDFLSYEPNTNGAHFKIGDGVTTNLGMHGMQNGVFATQFFDTYRGQCPVNFGGAFSDHWVRYQKLGLNVGDSASPDQISSLADTFEQELHNGWLGIDFEPEYTPGVQFDEIKALAQVAQKHGVPCFFHGRYSSHSQEYLTVPEIIRVAKETGASVHVAHLPSTGGTWHIQSALEQIHQARSEHYDVTACMYPYSYWATYLGSTRFTTGDWQTNFQISYNDLQIAGTSERLDGRHVPRLPGAEQAGRRLRHPRDLGRGRAEGPDRDDRQRRHRRRHQQPPPRLRLLLPGPGALRPRAAPDLAARGAGEDDHPAGSPPRGQEPGAPQEGPRSSAVPTPTSPCSIRTPWPTRPPSRTPRPTRRASSGCCSAARS